MPVDVDLGIVDPKDFAKLDEMQKQPQRDVKFFLK